MPGGGTLCIQCSNASVDEADANAHADADVGDYVATRVTDSGTGMSEDVLGRAFEPFFTTKDIGEGSGLGLSMVYGLVRQSSGHVNIDSESGSW